MSFRSSRRTAHAISNARIRVRISAPAAPGALGAPAARVALAAFAALAALAAPAVLAVLTTSPTLPACQPAYVIFGPGRRQSHTAPNFCFRIHIRILTAPAAPVVPAARAALAASRWQSGAPAVSIVAWLCEVVDGAGTPFCSLGSRLWPL